VIITDTGPLDLILLNMGRRNNESCLMLTH